MRSLSLVQRVCLDFSGSLFPHAVCLGDADNDSLNELVVGDTSGKLHIYKNDDSKPWITRTCVGMLTCVGVGDLCNKGKNLVVAVGAEGWFHLFDISSASAKAESSSQAELLFGEDQKPCFTQHIPANTKVMLISDIDGDGRSELVVGYTDRVVDSLSVNPAPDGKPELMVSQPGCGYAILLCTWTQDDTVAPGESHVNASTGDVHLRLTSGRIHNKNVSTHLIGSISRGSKDDDSKGGLFALCTLDGTLKLMDSSEQLLWSMQVDHQLFALQKLDVTGDGREEVVACAWDGQTYIIDHNRTVVRFQFDENVNAFCAGLYACKQGRNIPCLVYVSFSHKIYVYWSVELECMEPTSLRRVLEQRPEYTQLLHKLGVDPSDAEAVRKLMEDVLYRHSE
ncbi:KICSTOR complex protein ITFG2 [Bagarius yarrelli]|uniref:KICSTOR complex protein ITFG2 n=1 Tax=Bagarius yarrelli TaxID=175774 RepID=A0A556TI67_BAGYA|nr:KICSTOR complex protein ITFG2 [Bagarius yarrelli]